MSLQRIGDTAQAAATELTVGALTAIKASGQLMTKGSEATVDIFGNVADTGKNLTGTVSSVTGAIADLSKQMQTKTQQAAIALATTEKDVTRQKITLSKGKADVAIAQAEAKAQTDLLKNQNEYEQEQKKLKSDQEKILAELDADATQSLLKQQDNITNQEMAYYYGFKDSNPNSEVGFKKSIMPFSNWCYSYIPEYFVTTNAEMIEFIFPTELLKSKELRPSTITVYNKRNDKQKITIDFEYIGQKNFRGKMVYSKVPVIKYVDVPSQNLIYGKMYYRLLWFVCPSYIKGGRKRKTNKTHKRRKSNRRRTAARRHSRR